MSSDAFLIRHVPVAFPFKPYPSQLTYMEKVIEALQERKHALLESPTGTGKTMSLLCSALAWRQAQDAQLNSNAVELSRGVIQYADGGIASSQNSSSSSSSSSAAISTHSSSFSSPQGASKIIYTARTHSQLSQVVKELKCTDYRPNVAILGSREQLCVNPKVNKERGTKLNRACQQLTKNRKCRYHLGVEAYMDSLKISNASSSSAKFKATNQRASAMSSFHISTVNGAGVQEGGNAGEAEFSPAREIQDIEELHEFGKRSSVCPYYLSRQNSAADIIFMPYNYLVDPEVRSSLNNFQWQDAVVICDEAHNLEAVCADASSFELAPEVLANALEECDSCLYLLNGGGESAAGGMDSGLAVSQSGDVNAEKIQMLRCVLATFEEEIAKPKFKAEGKGFTADGSWLMQLMQNLNVTPQSKNEFFEVMDGVIEMRSTHNKSKRCYMETVKKAMAIILYNGLTPEIAANCYRVHIYVKFDPKSGGGKAGWNSGRGRGGGPPFSGSSSSSSSSRSSSFFRGRGGGTSSTNRNNFPKKGSGRTLAFWCFSPSVAMSQVLGLGVRSIILTSGTLSPMDSFAMEMRIPFDVRLQNAHVIKAAQVSACVVQTGPTQKKLNSTFQNRSTAQYQSELGYTITNFARLVPEGMLVFFPSYSVMTMCLEFWKGRGNNRGVTIWDQIVRQKAPFVEPRSSSEFGPVVREFEDTAASGRGAVFFAVCRGKASEGIDFSDHCARAVVLTGMPFPPFFDPKVRLKKEYLDSQISRNRKNRTHSVRMLSGKDWYAQQASRAVNQALGRVIRHRFDYGAILLCDERFAYTSQRSSLSKWIQPLVQVHKRFGDANKTISSFFRRARSTPEWNKKKPTSAIDTDSPGYEGSSDGALGGSAAAGMIISRPSFSASSARGAVASSSSSTGTTMPPKPHPIENVVLDKKKRVAPKKMVHLTLSSVLKKSSENSKMQTVTKNADFMFSATGTFEGSEVRKDALPVSGISKVTAEKKLSSLLTGSAQSSAITAPRKSVFSSRQSLPDQARRARLRLKKSRLKGASAMMPPAPPLTNTAKSQTTTDNRSKKKRKLGKESSSANLSALFAKEMKRLMSKEDRKRIQTFLITLSGLQRRLKPLAAKLPREDHFADTDREEVDSLLRSICSLFAESPQMLPLMEKFYGFVKLERIQKRYCQISAMHGIHIPM